MLLNGQVATELLKISDGVVRLCEDKLTCSYSIGITTKDDFQWKYISKELHDLLVKELKDQPGKKF